VYFVAVVFDRMDKLMDGLKLKLETAYKASGGRKVNIISHSMGGVLILCFMSLYRDVSIVSLHHYF
jgi:phospholipase A1